MISTNKPIEVFVMGANELKEAIEKGYLGGKLDAKKTFNMTHEMLDAMYVESEANGMDVGDWWRMVIANALVIGDYNFERSRRARQRSRFFRDTLGHHKEKSPVGATTEPDVQFTSEVK